MACIKLIASVKGAVTISTSSLVANQMDTASWISGSILRGAFASQWGEVNNADKEAFLNLFCRGGITFHGLFPLPSNSGEQADFKKYNYFPRRVPQALFSCKYQPWTDGYNPHAIVNKAIKSDCLVCPDCGAPLKQTKSPDFYYHDGKKLKPIKQKTETYLYHGTDRKTRRAEDAALYSYTSIPDGEGFIGWLSGEKDDLDKLYEKLAASAQAIARNGALTLPLNVGRAKKRRGHLETEIHAPTDGYPAMLKAPSEDPGGKIVVVLQAPAILYDSCFRARTTLKPEDLIPDATGIEACRNGDFSSMTFVEGWSGIHRLPRRPEQALAAGSTFVFRKTGAWTKEMAEALAKIQIQGIGDRRLEGYGRIAVNPPMAG